MAVDNVEIEVKIKLSSEIEYNLLKDSVNKISKFQSETFQIDEYFSPKSKDFLQEKFPFEWLSIRHRNDKSILNYKHFFPEGAEKHEYCNEYELTISDSEMMKKIFESLDIESKVIVEKKRQTYVYKDEFEIVLDEVKNLGFFIEIEAIKDFGGVELTRERLNEFVKELNINVNNIDYRGYPFQLLNK